MSCYNKVLVLPKACQVAQSVGPVKGDRSDRRKGNFVEMAVAAVTQTLLFETLDVDKGDEVEAYFRRFDLFCIVQKVPAIMTTTLFLASIGGTAFTMAETLLTPKDVIACTYEEIKKALIEHYRPKTLVALARHNLRERVQKAGETFNEFLAELKKLVRKCGFEDNARLEEEIMDQIIRGIYEERTRAYFLSNDNLTLEKVIGKALADEKALVTSKILNGNDKSSTAELDRIHARDKHKHNNYMKSNYNGRSYQYKDNDRKQKQTCYRCGVEGHVRTNCRINGTIRCFTCNGIGHMSAACKSNKYKRVNNRNKRAETNFVHINGIMDKNKDFHDKILVDVQINEKHCKMEVDTGSPISIISLKNLRKIAPNINVLEKVTTTFISYTKDKIKVLGKTKVDVRYKQQQIQTDLYVVDSESSTLLGREWLRKLKIDWTEIRQIKPIENIRKRVNALMREYNDIFRNEIGCLKGITANVEVRTNCKPIHLRARTIPYAMTERVNEEIDRLENLGILEKVTFSEWATPIVPVTKANGKDIRICGDYKVTVNKCLVPEQYPIPSIEEILASMANAKYFAKFDIREAYLHVLTNKQTADLLTVTTPKGLYKVKRMLYGVVSVPAIWQRAMDELFKGNPGICVFYDDIKVTASTENEFIDRIKTFFECCRKAGLRLKKEKCEIDCEEINYLGYKINKQGLHKTMGKIEAIVKAEKPRNYTEVKAFLGIVNYYHRFIPEAATRLHPIYELLKKDKDFVWSKECDRAFREIKEEIASDRILCLFDPEKPIVIAADASSYGLGATS